MSDYKKRLTNMKKSRKILLIATPSLVVVFNCGMPSVQADPSVVSMPQRSATSASEASKADKSEAQFGKAENVEAESCNASEQDQMALDKATQEKASLAVGGKNQESSVVNDKDFVSSGEDLMSKPDSFWRDRLDPDVYYVTRNGGTERPGTGIYNHFKEQGIYKCSNCGQPLFKSETKYDSGSGWPSFYEAVDPKAVILKTDDSHGMHRVEVQCSRCGAHLGHVFEDGPAPTGQRFCINSLSLKHERTADNADAGGTAAAANVDAKK
jgi:peptide-methionine (R)-S-oxide reductase